MAIGLSIIGLNSIEGNSLTFPDAVAYDTIELFGDAIFDDLWGRNELVDEDTILDYTTTTYIPEWTSTTYALARFENDLSFGNISGTTGDLIGWLVYRKDPDRSSARFLAELEVDVLSYKDYQAVINKEYSYIIYAKTTNETSNPLQSEAITPDYYGHFLIDVDNEVSYKFDINVNTSSFSTIEDYSEYSTNLEYNSYSRGKRKFKQGTITAIVRDEENCSTIDLNQTIELLDALEEFVTRNVGTKYLKTRAGEIYKVFTYGYIQSQFNDNIREQIYKSSFSFKEDGDIYGND